ncbi:MAG: TIR domain-containing protein [Candidatus Aminicenantes bacterium]|nr:TIR domain-containing protein [Candidatus Aminicenantes bacterium]NIM84193.1 TIR domain-containing protein [Candidatus Aminicenantes bacterium]NIN23641.1 TIR domain-containing protein [Candidatus Aminicenantes bacterium]NIN47348.1 TIR domain-containing protein [Candidatus Aminicenantes bacterium]NIN90277.1 TIR domain-containing protein [Candidatus Aminicenantes bacterium]
MCEFGWDEEDWKTLVFAIQQNDCILILGPDIATEVVEVESQRRTLTEILAEEMAGEIHVKGVEKINTSDLAQMAQYYCKEKGRMSLKRKVSSFYEKKMALSSDLHEIIAELPFYFVVTTTHDNMLIKAMKEKGRKSVAERYHFKGQNPKKVAMGTVEKPLVFYLYGSVGESDSLVLTENDLLDFLVALTSKKPPMAPNVLSELHNEDKCFLFLGVGFRHWYQRILLYVLQMRKKGSHSFAMERFIPDDESQLEQIVFFFRKSDYKINILGMSFIEFAEQLRDRLSSSRPPEKYKDGPQVFICHAHEDQEYASKMYEKFKTAGLRPWLDKEELRGGDLWDKMIIDTIREVDYVVVLQSKSMIAKVESYVFKEINCALERQSKFQDMFRFIIPVIIDGSPLLKKLESIQSIKISDKENIENLISTIRSDFEKRRTQ